MCMVEVDEDGKVLWQGAKLGEFWKIKRLPYGSVIFQNLSSFTPSHTTLPSLSTSTMLWKTRPGVRVIVVRCMESLLQNCFTSWRKSKTPTVEKTLFSRCAWEKPALPSHIDQQVGFIAVECWCLSSHISCLMFLSRYCSDLWTSVCTFVCCGGLAWQSIPNPWRTSPGVTCTRVYSRRAGPIGQTWTTVMNTRLPRHRLAMMNNIEQQLVAYLEIILYGELAFSIESHL